MDLSEKKYFKRKFMEILFNLENIKLDLLVRFLSYFIQRIAVDTIKNISFDEIIIFKDLI